MSWGIPYDSEKGRTLASAITSLLTGTAYNTSVELADIKGPFKHWEKNQEVMEDVLDRHYQATRKIGKDVANLTAKAISVWRDVLGVGCGRRKSVPKPVGFRNCQTTLLAPTGTIAFMMDCATTGCEPDIGLKKTKFLVGGSSMQYVNPEVPGGLRTLGYSREQTAAIVKYVEEHGHVEGSPLNPSDYAVFDCSYGAGQRSLSIEAHVDFVAAIQPFVSGAISKTFNMPRTATVLDVQRTFLRAWEKGVKSITVYREGSKLSEPLRVKEVMEQANKATVLKRARMPKDRPSITHDANIGGSSLYLTVSPPPGQGPLKEVFIRISKFGSTVGGLLDSFATLMSVCLQYGVPLEEGILKRMRDTQFAPSGVTDDTNIPMAKSILDYIAQWIAANYTEIEIENVEVQGPELTGETCTACGSMMQRNGASCLICPNCSNSTGVCG